MHIALCRLTSEKGGFNLGLLMGDLNASDWAVEAHMTHQIRDLSTGGTHSESPAISSVCVQGVVVDDRFILTIGEPSDEVHDSAQDLLDRSRSDYAEAGLTTSDKKAKRKITSGTVVGAHIDGDACTVAANPLRRLQLARISIDLVRDRRCTGHAARSLIST